MCVKHNSVLSHINGGVVRLDSCIRSKVEALNRAGQMTVASCCGHGVYAETILCRDVFGRIFDLNTGIFISRKRRFYRRDKKGFYYVPELKEAQKK